MEKSSIESIYGFLNVIEGQLQNNIEVLESEIENGEERNNKEWGDLYREKERLRGLRKQLNVDFEFLEDLWLIKNGEKMPNEKKISTPEWRVRRKIKKTDQQELIEKLKERLQKREQEKERADRIQFGQMKEEVIYDMGIRKYQLDLVWDNQTRKYKIDSVMEMITGTTNP